MNNCCEKKACEIEALRSSQLGMLKIVLFINALMFLVEGVAGVLAYSTSLVADSLDMFGDASVYAFSIYVVAKGPIWKAKAARFKAYIMIFFGAAVMFEAVRKIFSDVIPVAGAMGGFGTLALAANLLCLFLLFKHRSDDVNMRSTWICSRNDIVANVSVLLAAILVNFSGSNLPDIIVGSAIAVLFLSSAAGVLKDARATLNAEVPILTSATEVGSNV